MKTTLITGAVTLGTIAMTATSAFAFNPEIKEAVKEALNQNDYNSWVEAISESPKGEEMLELIDESNFNQLVEAHNLREAGDFEAAKAIAEELGIDDIMQRGKGQNDEKMQAVKDALDAGDYNAWVEAMGDGERSQRLLEIINESNFDRLVEIHNLRNQIRAISDELGLPEGGEFGPGRHSHGQGQMNHN